jgi:hypothetical protein
MGLIPTQGTLMISTRLELDRLAEATEAIRSVDSLKSYAWKEKFPSFAAALDDHWGGSDSEKMQCELNIRMAEYAVALGRRDLEDEEA